MRQPILFAVLLAAMPVMGTRKDLLQAGLLKPKADSWPTYNGDYSGRRFSPLAQIDTSNVHTLALAWAARFGAAARAAGGADQSRLPCW